MTFLLRQYCAVSSSIYSYRSIPDQTKHVVELNRKIQTLERENRRLRDENRKVKEQAQAAVQQLRKFTEWFFKNVKRQ